jgi:primary-amine oxidase
MDDDIYGNLLAMKYILMPVWALLVVTTIGAAQSNPFRQPTASELATAVRVIRADARCPARPRFVAMSLAEPSKTLWLDSAKRKSIPREVRSTIVDPPAAKVYEFTVDVVNKIVTEVRAVPPVQWMLTESDYARADSIMRASPRFVDVLLRRGVSIDSVAIETWASGVPDGSVRLVRCLLYHVDSRGLNRYDRPIEGVSALIDLASGTIIQWMESPIRQTPPASSLYNLTAAINDGAFSSATRTPTLVDGEVQWNAWRFTPMLAAREGLVIYNTRWVDGTAQRPIAHRMALSEMLVPYGDTSSTWTWRNAFDIGEYGFGMTSSSLRKGVDVPTSAVLLSASFVSEQGVVRSVPNAIAIFERDGGVAWRHTTNAQTIASQRRRELVVQHIATLANYDYLVSYIFSNDGTITVDIGLTGVMLVKAAADTAFDAREFGEQMLAHRITRSLLAPTHQHYFNLRLDLDIDGVDNVVTEVDVRSPLDQSENRFGNAMMMDQWDIRSEREGMRTADPRMSRTWRVSSTRPNHVGAATAFTVIPESTVYPLLAPSHPLRRRARFIEYQCAITKYNADEMYAAGAYPNQSAVDEGLPKFVANDDRLVRRDVVLWCTIGTTHVGRSEDWPVMPVSHARLRLLPTGFHQQNPLIVPQKPAPRTAKKK